MRCFIYAAGSFYGFYEKPVAGDLQIAADAGIDLCRREGISPDIVIGDFDSAERPVDENCLQYPVEKDDTDTMLALKEGLNRGCNEFYLYGCTGGARPDHTIANIQSLLYLCRRGAKAVMYDKGYAFTVIESSSFSINKTTDWGVISVFALGNEAAGVTLTGMQYPLDNGRLTNAFPLGVSNHIIDDTATITVKSGALLICWQLE